MLVIVVEEERDDQPAYLLTRYVDCRRRKLRTEAQWPVFGLLAQYTDERRIATVSLMIVDVSDDVRPNLMTPSGSSRRYRTCRRPSNGALDHIGARAARLLVTESLQQARKPGTFAVRTHRYELEPFQSVAAPKPADTHQDVDVRSGDVRQ